MKSQLYVRTEKILFRLMLAVLVFFLDEIHLRKCFSVHLVSLHFHLHLRQLKHPLLLHLLWLIFLSKQVYQELLDLILYVLGYKPNKSSFASVPVFDALLSQNFYLGKRKKKKGGGKKKKRHSKPNNPGLLQASCSRAVHLSLPGCWMSPDVCTFPSTVTPASAAGV